MKLTATHWVTWPRGRPDKYVPWTSPEAAAQALRNTKPDIPHDQLAIRQIFTQDTITDVEQFLKTVPIKETS